MIQRKGKKKTKKEAQCFGKKIKKKINTHLVEMPYLNVAHHVVKAGPKMLIDHEKNEIQSCHDNDDTD